MFNFDAYEKLRAKDYFGDITREKQLTEMAPDMADSQKPDAEAKEEKQYVDESDLHTDE